MKLGLLTVPFRAEEWPLGRVITWAGENGFDCLEVAVPQHLDPVKVLGKSPGDMAPKKITKALEAAGVSISSLAFYVVGYTDPDAVVRERDIATLTNTIKAAAELGVDTVCTLGGMPAPGKRKPQTIREDLAPVFAPILDKAGKLGVRIAFENYFPTNIQHLDHWKTLFEVLPQENLGLNFDPSHLAWQQIDYIAAVDEFASRIFHTHAKDVTIDEGDIRRVGVIDHRWWRYTIPGTGRIAWGEYLSKLRRVKFDGAISIEHEDATLGAEEGFRMGAGYLRSLMG